MFRALVVLVTTGFIVACGGTPQLDHREIPEKLKTALDSNVRTPTQQEQADNEIHYRATIGRHGPVTVPMLVRDGMPLVPARLNRGATLPFLVDTGSQGCILEARTAVAHNVPVLDGKSASMTLGGTSGSERALFGFPDEFSIGSWTLGHFPFFVRTRETRISQGFWERRNLGFDLIGNSALLLSCDYLTLDFPGKQVVFGIGGKFTPPEGQGVWKVPMLIRDNLPYVQLQTNGSTWEALLDSGFNGLLDMDRPTAQRLNLLSQARPTDATRIGLGAPQPGKPSQFGVVVIPKLESLGPKMVNISTLIVPERSKIGCALLRPFRVTLDYRRRLLWLQDPGRNE